MLTIDKGVPIPAIKKDGITDTFRKMKVGDSVFVLRRPNQSALQRALKIKLASRVDGQGFRYWRVK